MINRSDAFVTRHRRAKNIIRLIHNIIGRLICLLGKRALQTIIIVIAQIKIPSDTSRMALDNCYRGIRDCRCAFVDTGTVEL